MQGERAVAVGLSLTLHACLVGIVIARLALAPNLTPGTPIKVSFDAPPAIGESVAAALPQVLPSSGSDVLPAVAPASIGSVPPMPALSAAPAAPSVDDKGAGLELRPLATAPPSQEPDGPAPDLQALPPSAGQAIASTSPGVAAKPLASEDQVGPSAMAADPVPASSLASEADTLGTIPMPQAASDRPPAVLKSETALRSQPAAVIAAPDLRPRAPETLLGAPAVVPEGPAAAPPSQILADAPPSAPPPTVSPAAPTAEATLSVSAPLRASALPVAENPRPQPTPDVARAESLPVSHRAEAPATLAAMGTPQDAVIASLAPTQPSIAIDLTAPDTPAPPTDADRARQIRAFVDRYDGGPCFFAAVRRVSASSADIESFSTTLDAFRQFDRALKTSSGVEPTVSGQRIWSTQCPTVEYLRKLPHDVDATATLDLEHRDLDRGDVLSGTVKGAGGRPLRLFVVAETGALTDVSDALSERDGTPVFSFRPQPKGQGGPFPQILVLVVGAATFPLHPTNVDDLFKPLIAGNGTAYTVAAKMFLVTR